jgi:hypothetical protein
MAEFILGIGVSLVVGGFTLLIWTMREQGLIPSKPRIRRKG